MKNKVIPLKELVGINPGEVLSASTDDPVIAFYSQSYALVRFLREEDYGKRLANFHQMLMGGLHGSWPIGPRDKKIASDRNLGTHLGTKRH